jgi:hypothetical protein
MDNILNKVSLFQSKCRHGKYVIDRSLNKIECGLCNKELDPIWLLSEFANSESNIRRELDHLNELNKKAKKKNRCKCEKCGEMTRIQRN